MPPLNFLLEWCVKAGIFALVYAGAYAKYGRGGILWSCLAITAAAIVYTLVLRSPASTETPRIAGIIGELLPAVAAAYLAYRMGSSARGLAALGGVAFVAYVIFAYLAGWLAYFIRILIYR